MATQSNVEVSNPPPVWKPSRSIDDYEIIEQIGEGTYGQVYRAKHKESQTIVALKKIRMENEKEGFPFTAIREVKILNSLQHTNVVRLLEIVSDVDSNNTTRRGSIYLVFEYMDHDLAGLMDTPTGASLNEGQVKGYIKQLLEGIFFLHRNSILHRDIKASNLLISNQGVLKLADFGLARPVIQDPNLGYTNNVITLWYRPPELLLGEEKYGPAVDIWSAGCILAELLLKKPLFPGKVEADQLALIWDALGPPEKEWPEVVDLPLWKTLRPTGPPKHPLRERIAKLPIFNRTESPKGAEHAIELLERMLSLNPKKRISAVDALDVEWFWSGAKTMLPSELPKHYPHSHEWTLKNKRRGAQSASLPVHPQRVPPPGSQTAPHGSQTRAATANPQGPPRYPQQAPPHQRQSSAQQTQPHKSHPHAHGHSTYQLQHQHQPHHSHHQQAHQHRPAPTHSDPDMQAPALKRAKTTDAPSSMNSGSASGAHHHI